jgi:hypothetical protein
MSCQQMSKVTIEVQAHRLAAVALGSQSVEKQQETIVVNRLQQPGRHAAEVAAWLRKSLV